MATRKKSRPGSGAAEQAGEAVRASAQKIWLAGLGAFERAKSDGPKLFEALVAQGRDLGAKARESADQALRSMRETSHDAGGRWDKLEQVFEDRVSKSLNRLGVLTKGEVDDLSRQVAELNDNVRSLMRGGPAAGTGTKKKARAMKARARAKKPAKAATRVSRARRA
ncbi:MAG: phasin family protein [Usitatibacter sp.]